MLINAQRFEEAIVEFDKVISAEPKNANAYYGKGFALKRLHDDEGAMQQIRKSCDLGLNQACLIAAIVPKMKH